jgi:hypothetical protein
MNVSDFSRTVETLNVGYPTGANSYAVMNTVRPSPPSNVQVFSVSETELGVSWEAPQSNGGQPITKALIEWSYDRYFPEESNAKYSEVIDINDAATVNTKQDYSYQITNLLKKDVFVRVSLFNSNVYSFAASASPKYCADHNKTSYDCVVSPIAGETECNHFINHCKILPVFEYLYIVVDPTVDLNSDQNSGRLDVGWVQPTTDMNGFMSVTALPNKPDAALSYNIE